MEAKKEKLICIGLVQEDGYVEFDRELDQTTIDKMQNAIDTGNIIFDEDF